MKPQIEGLAEAELELAPTAADIELLQAFKLNCGGEQKTGASAKCVRKPMACRVMALAARKFYAERRPVRWNEVTAL